MNTLQEKIKLRDSLPLTALKILKGIFLLKRKEIKQPVDNTDSLVKEYILTNTEYYITLY